MNKAMIVAVWIAAWLGFSANAATAMSCPGDCEATGTVTVDEIVIAVNIALGSAAAEQCPPADLDSGGTVTVDELLSAINSALSGCPLPEPTATPPATPTPTMASDPNFIPTNSSELLPWLRAGGYLGWHAESTRHISGGPHTTNVRTYVNDLLLASLSANGAAHPRGAAAVKELYGLASSPIGWAVEVKVDEQSEGGVGWYWYERVGSSVFADGVGRAICTGCHSQDYGDFTSKDYVLSHFPLQ
jgi:hypothetical protein